MANQQLIATEEQRDLGITITRDLKCQKQTEKSCKTANRVLGLIAQNFNYKSTELMLPLYKSLVRPHLEYAVQFWSTHLRRDIDKTERVQRRATKMIPEIRNHSYQQRLKDLKLIILVQRRLRGQLIEVFKYLNTFNNVSPMGLLAMTSTIEPKIMEKINSEAIQHISSTAFFPHQHYNNLECTTVG